MQPVGNILSGFCVETMGRKGSMFIVNILPTIGWLLLATANTKVMAFASFILLGIGIGLCNSITYISEICEPSVRGVLSAGAGISGTAGIFMVFLLGSVIPWRHVAFICAAIPISNMLIAFFVPETPIYLLSKKKEAKAEKSLQWLRGWVSPQAVTPELNQLKKVSDLSTSCLECIKHEVKCDHPAPKLMDKFKDMTERRTLKPFTLITLLFLLMQFSGMFATRPYIVQILSAHGLSWDANFTTVALGVIGVFANICIVFSIRLLGKRNIYLYSMFGNFLTCFGLGESLINRCFEFILRFRYVHIKTFFFSAVYGYVFFPAGWSSIENTASEATTKNESIRDIVGNWNYFALAMFLLMQFFLSVGVSSVPYFLMTEVFPFKLVSIYGFSRPVPNS